MSCFNTPEGVEGFSSTYPAFYSAHLFVTFQYPGGC